MTKMLPPVAVLCIAIGIIALSTTAAFERASREREDALLRNEIGKLSYAYDRLNEDHKALQVAHDVLRKDVVALYRDVSKLKNQIGSKPTGSKPAGSKP